MGVRVVAEVEQESRCLTTHGGGLPHFGRRMFPGASALEAQNQLFALVAFVPRKSCKSWLRVVTIA